MKSENYLIRWQQSCKCFPCTNPTWKCSKLGLRGKAFPHYTWTAQAISVLLPSKPSVTKMPKATLRYTTEPEGRTSNGWQANSLFTSASSLKQTAETVIVHLWIKTHQDKRHWWNLIQGKPQLHIIFKTVLNAAERKLGLSIIRRILAERW